MEVTITHVGTATAIVNIDGINLLTDPAFPDPGAEYQGSTIVLKTPQVPALDLPDLPHIDGILLSHEDHPDNLDAVGRTLLVGRRVITTVQGQQKIAGGPDVFGMKPWETLDVTFGGRSFTITTTPCQHVPNGECIGFILQTESFGLSADWLPNVIYVSGDTVYIEELKEISRRFHVMIAILNLGAASIPFKGEPLQITMGGKQAAQLIKDLNPDHVVPMHFESWSHFTENKDALAMVFEEEGVSDKIRWLVPGQSQRII